MSSSLACLIRGLTDQRETGPGDGEGKDGILDLAQFLVESFRGLPAKIEASPNSEAEWVELQETRLDILQAMRRIVSLTQVAETEMDIATGP